jgi:putative addiction module component (TIGR02574 family)
LRASSAVGRLDCIASVLEKIREEIQALSTSEKEQLFRSLWEELDGSADADVDETWIEEARRRDPEIDQGLVDMVPADEVFARLRSVLKR